MESLPFDLEYQKHFINHLLRDSEFLGQVIESVEPDIFLDDTFRRIVTLVKNFWATEKGAPGTLAFRVLASWREKSLINEATYESVSAGIDDLFTLELRNKGYILREFNSFIRRQKFKARIPDVMNYVKADDWESAEQLVASIFAVQNPVQLDLGRELLADPSDRIARRLTEDTDRFWTLIPELDMRVPGLKPGEIGVWLSQETSAGKSAALQLLARSFAYQRKNTLIYTMEMSEEAYEDRLDQCIAGITKELLTDHLKIHKMLTHMTKHGGRIWIKQFPTKGATIEDLRRHKNILENTHNFRPDAIIVDYMDLLSIDADSLYDAGDKAYAQFRGWMVEEGLVGWTGSQSKTGAKEVTYADTQHTGGSRAKAEHADLVISINRTTDETKAGRTSLFVAKNRNGASKYPISICTDFSRMAFWRRSEDE